MCVYTTGDTILKSIGGLSNKSFNMGYNVNDSFANRLGSR